MYEITKQLKKLDLNIKYNDKFIEKFNFHHFDLFCKYYDIKNNEKLCFVIKQFSQPKYCYSMQVIDFVMKEIKKYPENILNNLKTRLAEKGKNKG